MKFSGSQFAQSHQNRSWVLPFIIRIYAYRKHTLDSPVSIHLYIGAFGAYARSGATKTIWFFCVWPYDNWRTLRTSQ